MHWLDLNELSAADMAEVFAIADGLREKGAGERLLAGKTFALFFPETSLRTRMTFEKGIRNLGGECVLFPPETLDRREPLADAVNYMANWADAVVVRHPSFATVAAMAAHSPVPVVNAMTSDNHPCEIAADLYAIRERRANYRELAYTFVGPAGNIARSWVHMASLMKLVFTHVGPAGQALAEPSPHYRFCTGLEEGLGGSDVVLTDSLPDSFRTADYIGKYQLTLERMRLTNANSLLNPCPPFFRGEETSEDAIASDYFVGYAFKKSLIHVQQAIILYCLSR